MKGQVTVIGPGTEPSRPNRALEVALGGIAAVCLILFGIVIGQHTGINDGRSHGIAPIAAPKTAPGSDAITFGPGSKGGRHFHNPFPSIGSREAGVSGNPTSPARSSSTGNNPTLATSASGGARAVDLAGSGSTKTKASRSSGSGSNP